VGEHFRAITRRTPGDSIHPAGDALMGA